MTAEVTVPFEDIVLPATVDAAPGAARSTVVLAPGAGSDRRVDHLSHLAAGLVAAGHRVVRFDFAYRVRDRRVPDRMPRLTAAYRAVLDALAGDGPVVAGGHSMGGRVASHVAAEGGVDLAGLLLLAYPLHPPKQPDRLRDGHLSGATLPVLWLRGSRDDFATVAVDLPASWTVHEVAGADHSFKVRKKDGRTRGAVLDEVTLRTRTFLDEILP